MLMVFRTHSHGQSLFEYIVLVSAVIFGVIVAARMCSRTFLGHAQRTERYYTVF